MKLKEVKSRILNGIVLIMAYPAFIIFFIIYIKETNNIKIAWTRSIDEFRFY